MLIIKERASGPDSERDTYILCGSICHATYFLNGRATIIDMSYRLFTWESYHETKYEEMQAFYMGFATMCT